MLKNMIKDSNKTQIIQIRNILAGLLVLFTLVICKVAQSVIIPIVIALFCFVLIAPLLSKLDKYKVPFVLTVVIGLCVIVFAFVAFIYTIVLISNTLIVGIPNYVERVAALDKEISLYLIEFFDFPSTFSIIKSLNIDWYGLAMTSLGSISSKVVSFFSTGMLILVFLLFLLLERKSFLPKMTEINSGDNNQKPIYLMAKMNKQISRYLIVKVVVSAATGLCFYFSSLIIGLDFAIVWGVLAFVLNFIPTIGSIVITVLTIFMAVVQFMPNISPIIAVAIMNVSIEMIIGNIIDPKLQGEHLNLSPFALLIFLSVWGYIWGIVGMFLAVPITGILQIILANIPSTRKFAILLSSGNGYLREEKARKMKAKKVDAKDGNRVENDIIFTKSINEKGSK